MVKNVVGFVFFAIVGAAFAYVVFETYIAPALGVTP